MVEDPVGDRVDAEALEHPVADLRMALEHEPLGLVERRGLRRSSSGIASLPRSWRLPPSRISSIVGSSAPSRRAMRAAARRHAANGRPCTRRGRRGLREAPAAR